MQNILRAVDRVVEVVGAIMTALMVVIVFLSVIGRYVFHHVPAWSVEVVLILMMWFGFLSIAIGFRYRLHIQVTMFIDKLPLSLQAIFDKITSLLIMIFGIILLVEGVRFTIFSWSSTLSVINLPTGIQYIVVPVAGALTFVYGLVWLFTPYNRGERS